MLARFCCLRLLGWIFYASLGKHFVEVIDPVVCSVEASIHVVEASIHIAFQVGDVRLRLFVQPADNSYNHEHSRADGAQHKLPAVMPFPR